MALEYVLVRFSYIIWEKLALANIEFQSILNRLYLISVIARQAQQQHLIVYSHLTLNQLRDDTFLSPVLTASSF